jgi:hypothetical protein
MKNTLQLNRYSRRLFWSSTLTVVSVYSAWYNELYDGVIRSLIVLSTSMIYWNNPNDGIIRKIDMISANGCLGYQLMYTSRELPLVTWVIYTSIIIGCLKCYINARYYGRKKDPDFDRASRWHMLIHLFGNIGNIILYDGIGPVKSMFLN